jgi:hypothetical protein
MVWVRSVRYEKFKQNIVARTFALIAPAWLVLQHVSCSSKTVPNARKRKETHQNMSLGCNCVDRERSLRKTLTRHRGTNFCINYTSLPRFAPSFVQSQNGSKWTQMERNAPKHEFRVQCCGLGVFVVKNSNKTSWHELWH